MSQTRAQLLKGFSNTSASDDAITVNSSGNVAIGTTTASTRLDVEGNGVPVEINSANSNSNKVQLSDAGTVRGYFGASSSASFLVSGDGGSEQFRVQAAGGISFNGDTAAINALDDYEEGNWTAALGCATSESGSVVYSNQTGDYVKIGKLCFVTINLDVSSSTLGGSNLFVNGLPFPARNNNGRRGGFLVSYTTVWTGISSAGQLTGRTETNQTLMRFNYHTGSLITNQEPTGANINSSGGALFISGCYEVE